MGYCRRNFMVPLNKHAETDYVTTGTTAIAVPGSDRKIVVPKRRRLAPIKRTPAMRVGIHTISGGAAPKVPDLAPVLYLP